MEEEEEDQTPPTSATHCQDCGTRRLYWGAPCEDCGCTCEDCERAIDWGDQVYCIQCYRFWHSACKRGTTSPLEEMIWVCDDCTPKLPRCGACRQPMYAGEMVGRPHGETGPTIHYRCADAPAALLVGHMTSHGSAD